MIASKHGVANGVGTDQLLMARLVDMSVAGDVVVVTRESESFRVTADEGCHGKVLVRARGRTVDDNHINASYDFMITSPLTACSNSEL